MPYGLAQHTIDHLRDFFAGYPAIERVVIYGSRAKGTERPGSDIDLVLDAPTMSLNDLLVLESALDDLMLPYKVDVSLRHQLTSPELLEHIVRVGLMFYEPTRP